MGSCKGGTTPLLQVVYRNDEFGFMLADILKQNKVNDSGMRFDPGVRTVDFDRFIAEYENDHTSCSLSTLINFTATEEEIEEALYQIQAQKFSEYMKEFRLFTLLWGVLLSNLIIYTLSRNCIWTCAIFHELSPFFFSFYMAIRNSLTYRN